MELLLWIGLWASIILALAAISTIGAAVIKRSKDKAKREQKQGSAWTTHNYLGICKEQDLHGQRCTKPAGHYGQHRWSIPPEERR